MAQKDIMRQRYQLFISRYQGRDDVAGVEQPDGSLATVPGGLTYERFMEHINGARIYSIYNRDDAGRVHFILFDLDVMPRELPWEELLARLPAKRQEVLALISSLGQWDIALDQAMVEFPTVGYHLLLFTSGPVDGHVAKAFARLALERAGLEFVAPFYPRELEGYGDLVRLPFRRNRLTGRRSNLVRDLAAFDPARYDPEPDFLPLEQVRPIEPSVLEQAVAVNPAATARRDPVAGAPAARRVASVDAVPPGTMTRVEVDGVPVLLANVKGQFLAVGGVCPHAQGPLWEGKLRGEEVECPWHGSRFSLRTGQATRGPAQSGLARYPVQVRGQDIYFGPAES